MFWWRLGVREMYVLNVFMVSTSCSCIGSLALAHFNGSLDHGEWGHYSPVWGVSGYWIINSSLSTEILVLEHSLEWLNSCIRWCSWNVCWNIGFGSTWSSSHAKLLLDTIQLQSWLMGQWVRELILKIWQFDKLRCLAKDYTDTELIKAQLLRFTVVDRNRIFFYIVQVQG